MTQPLYEVLELNIFFGFYIFEVFRRLLLSIEIPMQIEKIKLQLAVSFCINLCI